MVIARVQAFIGDFADGLQQFLPCRERAPCRFVVSGFIELHERVAGVQVSAKNHHRLAGLQGLDPVDNTIVAVGISGQRQ